jgi:ABC-type sugar transport system permease subunit
VIGRATVDDKFRVLPPSSRAPPAPVLLFYRPGAARTARRIIFPWLFTVWMSASTGRSARSHFVGFEKLNEAGDQPAFPESVVRTFYFTALAGRSLVLGTIRR